jgi:hypothetical protein
MSKPNGHEHLAHSSAPNGALLQAEVVPGSGSEDPACVKMKETGFFQPWE